MAERFAVNEYVVGSNPTLGAMDKDKEYKDKLAEEAALFVESLADLFDAMAELFPEKERKLFEEAVAEIDLSETVDEIRTDVGLEGIEEYEQEESGEADRQEEG